MLFLSIHGSLSMRGKKLEISERFDPPHPELLQFHLQLSVLKNMCGAGEDYSDDDDDDDDGNMLDK